MRRRHRKLDHKRSGRVFLLSPSMARGYSPLILSAEMGVSLAHSNSKGPSGCIYMGTRSERSSLMSAIRSKDTAPEIAVRSLLHGLGYRFRVHLRELPGTPDIVFSSRRKVIQVHGCFWHAHGCALGSPPRKNQTYWGPKMAANIARDHRNLRLLQEAGWSVLVLWECEIRTSEDWPWRLIEFLEA